MKGKANENGEESAGFKAICEHGGVCHLRGWGRGGQGEWMVAPRATSAMAVVKAGVERVVLRQLMGTRLILISLPGSSNFTDLVICGQLQRGEIRNDKYLHNLQRLKCHQMVF